MQVAAGVGATRYFTSRAPRMKLRVQRPQPARTCAHPARPAGRRWINTSAGGQLEAPSFMSLSGLEGRGVTAPHFEWAMCLSPWVCTAPQPNNTRANLAASRLGQAQDETSVGGWPPRWGLKRLGGRLGKAPAHDAVWRRITRAQTPKVEGAVRHHPDHEPAPPDSSLRHKTSGKHRHPMAMTVAPPRE